MTTTFINPSCFTPSDMSYQSNAAGLQGVYGFPLDINLLEDELGEVVNLMRHAQSAIPLASGPITQAIKNSAFAGKGDQALLTIGATNSRKGGSLTLVELIGAILRKEYPEEPFYTAFQKEGLPQNPCLRLALASGYELGDLSDMQRSYIKNEFSGILDEMSDYSKSEQRILYSN